MRRGEGRAASPLRASRLGGLYPFAFWPALRDWFAARVGGRPSVDAAEPLEEVRPADFSALPDDVAPEPELAPATVPADPAEAPVAALTLAAVPEPDLGRVLFELDNDTGRLGLAIYTAAAPELRELLDSMTLDESLGWFQRATTIAAYQRAQREEAQRQQGVEWLQTMLAATSSRRRAVRFAERSRVGVHTPDSGNGWH